VLRLVEELRAIAPAAGPLRTIFVGGGTPSLLRVELWTKLLDALNGFFDLSALAEFTVECNPESVTEDLMHALRAGGVNRCPELQRCAPCHTRTAAQPGPDTNRDRTRQRSGDQQSLD